MIDEKKLIEKRTYYPYPASDYEAGWNDCNRDWMGRIWEQQQVGGWTPVTYHTPVEEDGEDMECAYILDCPMPEEGQEVLVSFNGIVDMDVCCYDEGWYLDNRGDWMDVDAWMPLPKPYKESDKK